MGTRQNGSLAAILCLAISFVSVSASLTSRSAVNDGELAIGERPQDEQGGLEITELFDAAARVDLTPGDEATRSEYVDLDGGVNIGIAQNEAALARRRRRRQVSTQSSPPAGTRNQTHSFYHSSVVYAATSVPDLASATRSVLYQGDRDPIETFVKVDLPFNFSFYGHRHPFVYVSTFGYIYPHELPAGCPGDQLEACRRHYTLRSSFISPLVGAWVRPDDGNALLTQHVGYFNSSESDDNDDDDGMFVHFTWTGHLLTCAKTVGGACVNGETTFSATLYSDSRIVFNYQRLAARSTYGLVGFLLSTVGTNYGGTIGLQDSSYHHDGGSHGLIRFQRYDQVNLSSTFAAALQPRSITLTPLNKPACFTSLDKAECLSRPASLNCFWCPLPPGYNNMTAPFCTDGGSDRNALHVRSIHCQRDNNASFASDPIVKHKYYQSTVSTTGLRLPDISGNAELVRNHNGLGKQAFYMKASLPFDFPYFGHTVRNFSILSHGFLYPHPEPCSSCLLDDLFLISHIAPFYYPQVYIGYDGQSVDHGAIQMFRAKDNSFYHIVWKNVVPTIFLFRCPALGCRFCYCPDQTARSTFSVTLYPSGKIVFNYEKLAPRTAYISSLSISIHEAMAVRNEGFNWRLLRYEGVTSSSAFSTTSSIKSVVYTPLPDETCNTARSLAECTAKNRSLGCVWCAGQTATGLPYRPSAFCSDGFKDDPVSRAELPRYQCRILHPDPTTVPPTTTPPPPTTAVPTTSAAARTISPTLPPPGAQQPVPTSGRPPVVRSTPPPLPGGRTPPARPITVRQPSSLPVTVAPTTSLADSNPGPLGANKGSSSNGAKIGVGVFFGILSIFGLVAAAMWYRKRYPREPSFMKF